MELVSLSSQPGLAKFLNSEFASTISVPIDKKGTLHIATLVFYHTELPLMLYFVTSKNSEKLQMLKVGKPITAACVVGTYKGTPFTLQMRGTVQVIDHSKHQDIVDAYYKKRGNRHDDIVDGISVMLKFTPNWARFTDYTNGYERKFLRT